MIRPLREPGIGDPWRVLLLAVQAVAGLFGVAMLALGLWQSARRGIDSSIRKQGMH